MDISDLLALVVWIIVILSYVVQLVVKGFKRAEEEALRKAARERARSPLEPKGLRRLEASADVRESGEMEPMVASEPREVSDDWWGPELDAAELNEEDSFELPDTARRSLAEERAEELIREREREMAMPGSLEMEGEYSPEPSLRPMDQWVVDEDDLMLAWEMATGIEDEAEAFRREMIQDYHADAAESWLVPKGGVRREQVLSGVVWGTLLGPPRCKRDRRPRRAS
ncbi:MAG: hypothetical protein WCZ48_09685 [Bacillota bacterium]|jgi:hypothetical protein|nr:hypothetical protein [Bacillota bacterium]NLH87288.1 hypothetical protein [Bacillota bacterium]